MPEETKLPKTLTEALTILRGQQIAKIKSEGATTKRRLSRFVDAPIQKENKEE